jgi:hypothetical protein
MKISEFLSFLYQRGVIVQVDQGNININAPRGTLSPEIQDQLRERKEEIIAFLAGEQAVGYEYTPIRRVDRSQPIPASSSQRGLWFQYQLEGTSNTYNVPLLYHLIGVLNIPALEKSLQYLIARHESLRMIVARMVRILSANWWKLPPDRFPLNKRHCSEPTCGLILVMSILCC